MSNLTANDSVPFASTQLLEKHSQLSTLLSPFYLISASFLVAIFGIVLLLLKRRNAGSRRTSLVITGLPDAGKTSLLSTLVYGRTYTTHTSLQINSSVLRLPSDKEYIRLVDVPGHPRVRDQFREHLLDAKAVAFVVDTNSVSRNGAAVAEHLHHILHSLTSLPPSVPAPSLLIIAHKYDLLKAQSASTAQDLAISRVRTVLERELERRRTSLLNGQIIEGLGAEGNFDETELGGLDCGGPDRPFKFTEWDGGEIIFMATSTVAIDEADEKGTDSSCAELQRWLEETF